MESTKYQILSGIVCGGGRWLKTTSTLKQVCSIIAERLEFKEGALSELHNFVPVEDINELRLEIFQTLNDSSGFLAILSC